MRIQIHRRHPGGSALLIAVIFSALLGIVLASFLKLTTNDVRSGTRSEAWNRCIPVLEAGIEEALTHCYYNFNASLAANGWALGTNGLYSKTNNVYRPEHGLAVGKVKEAGYYVASISSTLPYVITCTGYVPLPNGAEYMSRTVRIDTALQGVFNGILSVRDSVDMNGNTIYGDSFDSRYETTSTGGLYDPLKAGDGADIHCTDGVLDKVSLGNARLWGHVYTGPTGVVTTGSNGKVGSVSFHNDTSIKNGIEDGWWQNDYNASLPPVPAPYASAATPLPGIYNGTNYSYVLTGGDYVLGSVSGGKVVITGKSRIYFTGSVDLSGNNDLIQIEPGASLELYVGGTSAKFGAIENPQLVTTSLKVFGLPTCTNVKLSGSRDFYGLIYAPKAALEVKGGVHFYGSFCVNSAKLLGSCNFHYDLALGNVSPYRGFVITDWQEL